MYGEWVCVHEFSMSWWKFQPSLILRLVEIVRVLGISATRNDRDSRCSHVLIFGGYVKMKESIVYPSYYLGQHHSRPCWRRYNDSCMVFRPKWRWKQKYFKYPCPIGIKKWEILIKYTSIVWKKKHTERWHQTNTGNLHLGFTLVLTQWRSDTWYHSTIGFDLFRIPLKA